MKLHTAKELILALTQRYFANANVVFARQSRVAKMDIPLITLTFGNVKRSWDSPRYEADGYTIAAYPSRVSVTVDLYTHGVPVKDEDGTPFSYENTAMDEMLAFADFLGSQFVIDWCNRNDVSLSIDGDLQDLTGLVNDNNYEFRSRMNLMFYFTQKTVGSAGVLSEDSIQYPTGEFDADGNPIFTTVEPRRTTSSTGLIEGSSAESGLVDPVIFPVPEITPSGGSEELAKIETGYFTSVS